MNLPTILAATAMLIALASCTPNRDLDTGTPTWPKYGPYPAEPPVDTTPQPNWD